jgi:Ala-tRNA(Pro) deacylase
MSSIDDFLRALGIDFRRFDHPAVFTCEESEKLPAMPGARTKNLFLTDKKESRFWLVTVGHEKRVDLKALAGVLGVPGLTFGSPEKLKELLGVEPGSVTLLGVRSDADHRVQVVLDEELWREDLFQCHPLVNTATLCIPKAGLLTFFEATGHAPAVLDVPARSA